MMKSTIVLVIAFSMVISTFTMPANPINDEDEHPFDNIVEVNKGQEGLFEVDMKLSPFDVDINQKDIKRNARRDRHFLWRTKNIPYVIDNSLISPTDHRATIQLAFDEYSTKTCLNFVPKTSNDEKWIRFYEGSGCWSYVGRQSYSSAGAQDLSLGSGCVHKGTIIHELKHALGFFHEQSRTDRDQYVEVMWENIADGKESNFAKYDNGVIDDLGKSYDFGSVMHYGRYFFSKNGQPTIQKLGDPNYSFGQRNGLSTTDALEVNALYDCSGSGVFSSWSEFGPCKKFSNGDCLKSKQRFCTKDDISECSGANSYGIETEWISCTDAMCNAPVDGHWGMWSTWNSCSTTCGSGLKTRTRVCDNPAPTNGGAACTGSATETNACDRPSCALNVPPNCDFESGFCNWVEDTDDEYTLSRYNTGTPSVGTGPSADHTDGTGYYVYLETSVGSPGHKARLIGPILENVSHCLKFYYHMYGSDMGALSVYMRKYSTSGTFTDQLVWNKANNQGNQWLFAQTYRPGPGSRFSFVFEMKKGAGYTSDIAIDDIQVKLGYC